MRVHVLVVDGTFDTGLSAVLDTLAMANELAAHHDVAAPFCVTVVGVRKRVTTQHGLLVPSVHASSVDCPDLVVVPAMGAKMPDTLADTLERRDVADAKRLLLAWVDAGARVAAACTGTYLLAWSGLLDGCRATTTWWLGPDFRERFPNVELDQTRMVVEDGDRITAGAALAHFDLGLWLVRMRSPVLARTTSRYLLFDGRPSQATYALTDHLAHDDPVVARFERWARANLRCFDMEAAARAVGTSQRTLQRKVQQVLGCTPIHFVGDLRVEHAVHRLETSDDSIEVIADAVGYQDGVTLRTLLRDRTGMGVRALRGRRAASLP